MEKTTGKGSVLIVILAVVIVIGILAILAAILLPMFTNGELSAEKKWETIQEARTVYRQHWQAHGSTEVVADYYFYQSDENRVVSIVDGKPIAIYTSLREAIEKTTETGNLELLEETATSRLYSYREKIDLTKPDGDNMFSMLMIGNSFSADAIEYIADIAMSAGQEEVYLGNLYIGGCSLATHAQNARSDAKNYYYFCNENGRWNRSTDSFPDSAKNTSILDAIQSHSWDYICLQQVSGGSGDASTYNWDLQYLVKYVQTYAPNAKLIWHMTWAYQQDSTHPDFSRYDSKQETMYNHIVSAVQNHIVTNDAFDRIVPAGTAVQNVRTSYLGDNITMDGYHMARPGGRYVAGLTFVRCLTDLDLNDVTFLPPGMTEAEKKIAIEAVENAYQKPFEVTPSEYTTEE